MSFDAHANFAVSLVATAPSPALSGTTLSITPADASLFPAAPFNVVVWPADAQALKSNAEIVRVTNKGTGANWTITREQEGTTAKAIAVGYLVAIAATAKLWEDIEAGVIQHGDAAKATPEDADEFGYLDSAAAWVKKTLTWANVKATLKTYFDDLYAGATHASAHKHGGADEVATATPAANAIPKSDGSGKLDSWVTADAAAATTSLRKLGTGATEACAGNDARLSDARPPSAHASSHASGQSDAIKLDDLAAPDNNTDLDAGTTAHGLLAKTSAASKKLTSTELGAQAWSDDIGVLGITIDGGGSAITTGVKGYLKVPFACEVMEWTLIADQAGSISIDVWADTQANFPPTVADSLPGALYIPTLNSAQIGGDVTSEWNSTGIAAGNVLAFNADDIVTVTRVTLVLKVRKTY